MSKSRAKKGADSGRDGGGFVALPWVVLDSAAYAGLSHPARGLLLELCRQLRSDNNGRLDYLRSHAERLYSVAVMPETAGAHALLAKIRAGKLADGFTPRNMAVKGWAGLASVEAARKAADMLVDFDWLVREVVPTGRAGGRPGECYRINPLALPKKA